MIIPQDILQKMFQRELSFKLQQRPFNSNDKYQCHKNSKLLKKFQKV